MRFRRNKQTLTQKPQAQRQRPTTARKSVFSYYARGTSSSSQNLGRDQNQNNYKSSSSGYRFRFKHIPSYIALIAILIAVINTLLLEARPRIVLVQTTGTVQREAKIYQDGIEDIWSSSLLNRSKLSVNTDKISSQISKQYSELASVEIELPLLGKRPTIRITPTRPTLELITSNGAFYVNSAGRILAQTKELNKNKLEDLAVIHDESGTRVEAGEVVIPSPQVTFLHKLHSYLIAQDVPITSMTLPLTAANQVDLRVDGQPYYVKFSMDSDPRQAVGTYLAAVAKLESDGGKPGEYIDVRVPEKVFYR